MYPNGHLFFKLKMRNEKKNFIQQQLKNYVLKTMTNL